MGMVGWLSLGLNLFFIYKHVKRRKDPLQILINELTWEVKTQEGQIYGLKNAAVKLVAAVDTLHEDHSTNSKISQCRACKAIVHYELNCGQDD